MRDDHPLSIQWTHLDDVTLGEVRGEIDVFTAPRLRESVEQACELGVPVVLDMDLVTFMDASGISVLLLVSGRATGLPRPVRIQRASAQVRRILSLTGLDKTLNHRHEERIEMDEHRLTRLMSALQRSSGSTSVLERICRVCTDIGLDGAGVTRVVGDARETLVATDAIVRAVEALQNRFVEGPCVEAMSSRHRYLEPDLSSARAQRRWPRFSPAAVEHGMLGAFAFPLILGGQPLGALDVYSQRRGDLTPDQVEDSMMLADLAALAIEHFDAAASIDGVDLAAEPSAAWVHSAVVHNATGMVSAQLAIHVDEALLRLRAMAFVTGRPLADIARDVVDRQLRIQSWAEHD
jgi:anti-anti-sigma factor